MIGPCLECVYQLSITESLLLRCQRCLRHVEDDNKFTGFCPICCLGVTDEEPE